MPEIKFVLPIIGYIISGIALCFGAYTDYKSRTIPNSIPLIILLCGCLSPNTFLSQILNLVCMIVILLILNKLCHYKSGGGDLKLYLSLSFLLGLIGVAIVLAITVVLHFIVDKLKQKKHQKGESIPLCSYIAPAYIVMWIAIIASRKI